MLNNIDEDEKTKKVTPIYNVYNGQYENQEAWLLTEDEEEKVKNIIPTLGGNEKSGCYKSIFL